MDKNGKVSYRQGNAQKFTKKELYKYFSEIKQFAVSVRSQFIIILIMVVVALSCLTYTIIDQQKKINQLEQQLQEVQRMYEIIKKDPLARNAMEVGGELMAFIVLGFVTVVGIIFVGVVVGKAIDKREEELIGKEEIKNQKEKKQIIRESQNERDD